MTSQSDAEHAELQELLGVYALDAVDKETAERVERHLAGCLKCSVEVAHHHEVAGLLANSGSSSPERLWDGIAGQLDGSVPPPWERLAKRLGGDDVGDRPVRSNLRTTGKATSSANSGEGEEPADGGTHLRLPVASNVVPLAGGRRRTRVAMRVAAVVAGAAAVTALVLGVQVHHLDQRVTALQSQPSLAAAERAALAEPSTERIQLTGPTGPTTGGAATPRATVVLTASGTGFVEATGLSTLSNGRTYQLWGVVAGQTISLGLMGSAPKLVSFTVDGNAPVTAFAVTAEHAGGVAHSANQPVVAGRTSA